MRHKRFFLFVTLFMATAVYAGTFYVPRVAGRYLRGPRPIEQSWISNGIFPSYAGPVIEVIPSIGIDTPRVIRVSETKRMSVSIQGSPMGHSSELTPGFEGEMSDQPPNIDNRVAAAYTVELKAADDLGVLCAEPKTKAFSGYPSNMNPQTWYCTVHPKQAGDYEVLISGLPSRKDAGDSFTVYDLPEGESRPTLAMLLGRSGAHKTFERFSNGTVSIPIEVVTVQGLTAGQWGWLQALGAGLGILGTIFAFPFLKSKFGDPVPLVTPLLSESEQTKDKKKNKSHGKKPK